MYHETSDVNSAHVQEGLVALYNISKRNSETKISTCNGWSLYATAAEKYLTKFMFCELQRQKKAYKSVLLCF
jgi:hypothetical protein